MTRALIVVSLLAVAATASAQQSKAPATKSAVPPTKSALPPSTKGASPAGSPAGTKTAAPPAAGTKTAATDVKAAAPTGTGTKAATPGAPGTGTKAAAQGAQGQAGVAAPETQQPFRAVIMREVYDYDSEGRRDPFFTLLATAELRPTVADLRIVGILYDPTGRRSIVTLREISTNTRYQVTTGTTLGRMKVVLIRPKAVIFAIEEFGLNRQDSLVLGDTTKARGR